MEKKEITLLDLVKIAARWVWVLLIGAVVLAAVAFFYSTEMVTPMYASSSKFVIQTKSQSESANILDAQRDVAYAQLVVGTYIDIVNTRDFAQELANYMNGNFKENALSSEALRGAVNTGIKHGIIADGGIVESGRLKSIIDKLINAGLIEEKYKNRPVQEVVEALIMNEEVSQALTDEQIALEVQKALGSEKWLPDYIMGVENLYTGDSAEKIAKLNQIGLEQGKIYGGREVEYQANEIASKMSFSTVEESTTFTIRVSSASYEEAYTIARLCEIVMGDYVEIKYPGQGVITTIDGAVKNPKSTNNNTLLLTLIGFIGGFVLAYVVVYIIELADNRIKNEEELAQKTGLSVVGIIPDAQYEKGGTSAYDKRLQ